MIQLLIGKFGLVPFLGGLTRSSDHERTDFQAPAVEVRPLSATLASLDITLAKCPTAASLSATLAALDITLTNRPPASFLSEYLAVLEDTALQTNKYEQIRVGGAVAAHDAPRCPANMVSLELSFLQNYAIKINRRANLSATFRT